MFALQTLNPHAAWLQRRSRRKRVLAASEAGQSRVGVTSKRPVVGDLEQLAMLLEPPPLAANVEIARAGSTCGFGRLRRQEPRMPNAAW